MAEQEACTELVDRASQEQSTGGIEGESLLLPLLQGLLQAPENEQLADSGTESGEDQRSGLIAEVQNALEKLSVSLRSDATDITPERRSSLLHLVTKLQSGLASTNPKLERRLSSGPGRFIRRRNRQNRHTVGVSSEELADARRLIEEISIPELTPSNLQNKVLLEKQNSETSITSNSSLNKFNKNPVKNAVAKPFNSSSNSISNASSSVQTPTEPSEHLELLFGEEPTYYEAAPILMRDKVPNYAVTHSSSIACLEPTNKNIFPHPSKPISLDSSEDVGNIKIVHQAVQQAAARKKGTSESNVESETEEDDTSTMKETCHINESVSQLHENPIYSKPDESTESSSKSSTGSYEEKVNRFNTNSKKLRMKRANTIDIPKALLFYADEDDSDTEDNEEQRKLNYYALRGPIRVEPSVQKTNLPIFQPKTESDQKFLAFINKNNQNSNNKGSLWAPGNKTTVWGNKFGNIKKNFEISSSNNVAKNFWKSQDDATTLNTPGQYGPKISRRSARNLQQMFEEKQRKSQEKIVSHEPRNVVTGSLTLKREPERNHKFIPQPLPVNKFSHAPQSAFKPIPKKTDTLPTEPEKEIIKTEIKENSNDPPLYLYSPKPILSSQSNSSATSPITSKPWVTNAAEHGGRVLSMAAKKFQVPAQQENFQIKPKRLSKDINRMFTTQQSQPERITAPYLTKSTEQKTNTVRKLSGQYDNLGNKNIDSNVNQQTYIPSNKVLQYSEPVQKYTSKVKQIFVPNNTHQYQAPQSPLTKHYDTTNAFNYSPQAGNYNTRYNQPHIYNAQSNAPVNYIKTYDKPQTNSFNYNRAYDKPRVEAPPPKHDEFQSANRTSAYDGSCLDRQVETTAIEHQIKNQDYSPTIYQAQTKDQTFEPMNYSKHYNAPLQIFQHVPGKESQPHTPNQQFTSSYQYQPNFNQQNTIPVQVIEPVMQAPKLQTQLSSDSVHEYTAISSKVMTGPVSQQAVTVRQKSPMNRNQHDMEAAFQLKKVLQNVNKNDISPPDKSPINLGLKSYEPQTVPSDNDPRITTNVTQPTSPNNSFKYRSAEPQSNLKASEIQNRFKYPIDELERPKTYNKYSPSDVPKPAIAVSSIKSRFEETSRFPQSETKTYGVVKPMQQKQPRPTPIYNNVTKIRKPEQSLEINDRGQNVLTGKFHIPVINVAPNSPGVKIPTHSQVLSKSDSWHQICTANQNSPAVSSMNKGVIKSKSSHNLAVPQKQFEAGMSKAELLEKKRTIEAYFATGKSPEPEPKVIKRSINRMKTSAKVSAFRQPSGLARSRTLPDIVCPDLLDESNVDKSFDDLFKSSS